ncbi:MAG: hypothetical protein ACJAR1_001972 [Rubritalea sp.]|jgi:hypothetical protein|tara:strand:- start:1848 stop:2423 length:576 start_codon:yes stop_codon:yes gene_type:complete
MNITADKKDFIEHSKLDRVGIFASILCAIHCALTPLLLILLPTFGKAWSHPSTHWGMAIVVIPIAFFMLVKGYKRHAKKWIIFVGSIGILLIIIGAILPYTESSAIGSSRAGLVSNSGEIAAQSTCAVHGGCVDNCCPSIVENEAGETSLHIPPASIVTTLGGLFLIAIHIGNLCGCSNCEKRSKLIRQKA